MGIAEQLEKTDAGFATVAAFPELRKLPIVIGEFDPEGCAACQGPQLGYRNGTMYSSYTAASFARLFDLARKHGVHLEGALTWAFEFEDQPYFAGFRVMATNGIVLPVFNVHRMMAKMSGRRIEAKSSADLGVEAIIANAATGNQPAGVRGAPDIAALASFNAEQRQLAVLVWYYHDDDLPGPLAAVDLAIAGLPAGVTQAKLAHYRVDQDHSNAYTTWKSFGSPVAVTKPQYAQLEAASQLTLLTAAPTSATVANGTATLKFNLPRQGVSLLVFDLP